MAMKKFKLEKLLAKVDKEQSERIVEIMEPAAKDMGVEVGAIEVTRRDTSADADTIKAAAKFDGEPKPVEGTFPMLITTRQLDRDQEIVMPKGIDLSEWKKTGVVIDCHDYSKLPLGKCVWVGVNDFGIKVHIAPAPTDRGAELLALSKFMTLTTSIGMASCEFASKGSPEFDKLTKKMAREWPEFKPKQQADLHGIIAKCMLLEVSVVPVPSNPNAAQTALAKSAVAGDDLTDDEKTIVRKAFDLGEDDGLTPEGHQVKALESEVRDLKAKVDQLITDKAELEEAAKLLSTDMSKQRRTVEVVKTREVEVIGQHVDVVEVVKHALDIRRGRV